MKRARSLVRIPALLLLPSLLTVVAPAAAVETYVLVDLPPLLDQGHIAALAKGINEIGHVVGYSAAPGGAPMSPVLWDQGVPRDLGTFGGDLGDATAVNNHGDAVGWATHEPPDQSWKPCIWEGGGPIRELPTLGGDNGWALDINDSGWAAGWSQLAVGWIRACLWRDTTVVDLGTFGGPYSQAWGINSLGQIVGQASYSVTGPDHAFVWGEGSAMRDLGTLGGYNSLATGINDLGWIVGWSEVQGGMVNHAFLYQDTTMTDLGTLDGGLESFAFALNDSGLIVGSAKMTVPPYELACLWEDDVIYDLNDLLALEFASWTLVRATDINNVGWIAGYGRDSTGATHGFILIPESATSVEVTPPGAAPVVMLTASPNPFTSRTALSFELRQPGPVALRVFDVAGRLVRVFESEVPRATGRHIVEWDGKDGNGRDLAAGIYLCHAQGSDWRGTIKLMLLR